MRWDNISIIVLSKVCLAIPGFLGSSRFQNQDAPPNFPHAWLEFFLAIMAAFLLFNWLYARWRIRRIVGSHKVSFDCFCDKQGISNREKEILGLVIEGKTCSDIEKLLFISKNTVRNHVHSIYQKLNVNNRVALINLVRESMDPGMSE